MALAPIRGAPPGAPIPDFPIEEPSGKPAEPSATTAATDQPSISRIRRNYTPIEIRGRGVSLSFRVIPELPAIARASMTIDIIADAAVESSSDTLGFLRMSAANARAFLTELRNGCAPIVATGDEGGTAQIEFEVRDAGPVLLVRKPGEQHAMHCWVIDGRLDLQTMADELLADLGA
jgi:hypothetical protein